MKVLLYFGEGFRVYLRLRLKSKSKSEVDDTALHPEILIHSVKARLMLIRMPILRWGIQTIHPVWT